jgi:hypothetical protein
MMKALLKLLASYAQKVLGAQAEFGGQTILPGFKTNSSYSGMGASRYIFVEAVAAGQAVMASNIGSAFLLGVMQNDPAIGEAMTIAVAGFSKVVAGGAIAANALITNNASGRAALVTSGDMVAGRLLEASGADGDVVSALLFHPVRWSGA